MSYYYIIPMILTVVYAFAYGLVHVLLALFDRLNFFWDWWDVKRKEYPFLVILEFIYFGLILYYIVYCELSGNT